MFEKNVGMIDRVFRAVFGVLFIAGGVLYLTELAMLAAIFVGIVLLFTAMSGSCLIYSLLGIRTSDGLPCDMPKEEEEPVTEVKEAPMAKAAPAETPKMAKAEKPKAKKKPAKRKSRKKKS